MMISQKMSKCKRDANSVQHYAVKLRKEANHDMLLKAEMKQVSMNRRSGRIKNGKVV